MTLPHVRRTLFLFVHAVAMALVSNEAPAQGDRHAVLHCLRLYKFCSIS